jgi:superfamily II DNA or RNA helicase
VSTHHDPVREDLLPQLRGWQKDAYWEYFRLPRRDFLLVATPGAGKTAYALTVAAELLARREVATLTIVTPTEHLKHQWAEAASRFGIAIDSAYSNAQGRAGADFHGVAVTYAQVAAHPALHRQRTEHRRTLVVFDEIHHAGDALSWGDAVKEAFDPARRRLALTGTPFRSDANPIPFVTYTDEPGGGQRSSSDYVYGYAPALEDGVVRPVIFLAYSGEMRWRTRAGDEITATLGTPMTRDQIAQAWRTALDPAGEWVTRVLEAADKRLTEVRRDMPDAAGLVIAGDHADARAYAALLRGVTGKRPVVVLSDDPTASKKIAAFAASGERWMVAVRMVSEGVDIPRLAVGVYATSVSTALYFAQAVGRFVRARRRGETASVFLPSVPVLLGFAAELEAERDHVLRSSTGDEPEVDELAEAQRERNTPDVFDEPAFQPLNASVHFDRVLYDGGEFGTAAAAGSPEEEDFLGLPGLLDPDQVRTLLRKRQQSQLTARSRDAQRTPASPAAAAASPSPARAAARSGPAHAAASPSPARAAQPGPAHAAASPGPARAAQPAPGRTAQPTRSAPSAPGRAAQPGRAPAATPAGPPVTRQQLAALRKELNGLVGAWSHRTGQPHGVIHNELRQACGGPALPQATADQIQARMAKIRSWALSGR